MKYLKKYRHVTAFLLSIFASFMSLGHFFFFGLILNRNLKNCEALFAQLNYFLIFILLFFHFYFLFTRGCTFWLSIYLHISKWMPLKYNLFIQQSNRIACIIQFYMEFQRYINQVVFDVTFECFPTMSILFHIYYFKGGMSGNHNTPV